MRHHRPPHHRATRTLSSLPLCSGLLLLFIATSAGCGKPKVREFPEELIGHWTTSDARYRDRYMDFRPEEFELGLGDQGSIVYELNYVEIEEIQGEIRYVIHYRSEGERYEMELRYDTGTGVISFPNQRNMIWRKSRNL